LMWTRLSSCYTWVRSFITRKLSGQGQTKKMFLLS